MTRSPPLPYCRVAELISILIAIGRGCTRMRGKWTFPGHNPRCGKSGCFPDRDDVRGKTREGKSSVRARPEVSARDDGCFPEPRCGVRKT